MDYVLKGSGHPFEFFKQSINFSSPPSRQQNSGNSKNVRMAFTARESAMEAMTYLHVHISVDTGLSSQASLRV